MVEVGFLPAIHTVALQAGRRVTRARMSILVIVGVAGEAVLVVRRRKERRQVWHLVASLALDQFMRSEQGESVRRRQACRGCLS